MVDELSLSNIKTFDDRLENLNFEYDFLVTRAIKLQKFINNNSINRLKQFDMLDK